MKLFEAERAARSLEARKAFFNDGRVPVGVVPGQVWRSWKRCQAAGQEPGRSIGFDTIARSRVAEIKDRGHDLIAAAREEMEHVAAVVCKAGMVALLADDSGAIVHMAGDTGRCSPRLRLAARAGVNLGERAVGTNAVGTALVEKRPVSIVAREHYFELNSELTCIAAPVFCPSGALVGALDLSGDYNATRADCVELVTAGACAIENNLLRRLRDVVIVAISPRAELLGTPWEGLLAFDPAGRLIAGNARGMTSIGAVGRQSGVQFEDLFNSTKLTDVLGGRNSDHPNLMLNSFTGFRFAARIEGSSALRAPRPPAIRIARENSADSSGQVSKQSSMRGLLEVACGDERTARSFERARRAGDLGVPVLVVGETGTGKELIARGLHELSERSAQPFVVVNCTALPETLIEAELFGHAEGAFTGARRGGAAGKVELADRGTLFLDEIGDMPLALQSRLLRVLEERAVTRLGEGHERPVDFRLVCATHRNLPDLVARGSFREDLYYRINGLRVALPALRMRANIPAIAEFFVSLRSRGSRKLQISHAVGDLLLKHPWPGNLRQLDHVLTIGAAFVADDEDFIEVEHLPDDFVAECSGPDCVGASARKGKSGVLVDVTADLIQRTVTANSGNISAAARALRISRSTIYNWRKRS